MTTTTAKLLRSAGLLFGFITFANIATPSRANIVEFPVGGTAAASSIQPTVDTFRAALGDPNNASNPGPLGTGRREINWDGGGATMATISDSTFIGFQNTRGTTFATPGTDFLQTPLGDAALTGIQANYATTFSVFSAQRVFTPFGSNVTNVTFSIPGTGGATAATVKGFGAVFSDVDTANTTKIELFAVGGASLGVFDVLPGSPGATAPNGALSFLGLLAGAGERIAKVQITTGNQPLGLEDNNGDPVDVVVMDDFLYSEPAVIPEPASLALATMAAAAIACFARRGR